MVCAIACNRDPGHGAAPQHGRHTAVQGYAIFVTATKQREASLLLLKPGGVQEFFPDQGIDGGLSHACPAKKVGRSAGVLAA